MCQLTLTRFNGTASIDDETGGAIVHRDGLGDDKMLKDMDLL